VSLLDQQGQTSPQSFDLIQPLLWEPPHAPSEEHLSAAQTSSKLEILRLKCRYFKVEVFSSFHNNSADKVLTYPVVVLDSKRKFLSFVRNQNFELLLPLWIRAVAQNICSGPADVCSCAARMAYRTKQPVCVPLLPACRSHVDCAIRLGGPACTSNLLHASQTAVQRRGHGVPDRQILVLWQVSAC